VVVHRYARASLVHAGSPDWEEALALVAHDVYHLPQYSMVDLGYAPGHSMAFVYTDGRQVFLLPLQIRPVPGTSREDAISAYGYPGPVSNSPVGTGSAFWRDACAALRPALAEAAVVSCFVRLHPLLASDLGALSTIGAVVRRGSTVTVDLSPPHDALWSGYRSNHRRQITAAVRRGLSTRFDDWSQLAAFVDSYQENMRYVGAQAAYFFGPDYVDSLRSQLTRSTHLVTAHYEGELVGGGLFFEHDGVVQYHLGATCTSYRDMQPMKTVLHETIRWAKSRGNRVLHLGGGLGGKTDSLFHFKAGFSAGRAPFHTWQIVVDPPAYAELSAAAEDHASDDPEFFPTYRRR
jgi:hypothetical protein